MGADFYSDSHALDMDNDDVYREEEKHNSSEEYDHLDSVKTDTKINKFFKDISEIMDANNPSI